MIIPEDISSFRIFGKKNEKNKVIKNRKTYCTPLKEFRMGSMDIGAKDMANACSMLAIPPDV